jgi:hypothetical protein
LACNRAVVQPGCHQALSRIELLGRAHASKLCGVTDMIVIALGGRIVTPRA